MFQKVMLVCIKWTVCIVKVHLRCQNVIDSKNVDREHHCSIDYCLPFVKFKKRIEQLIQYLAGLQYESYRRGMKHAYYRAESCQKQKTQEEYQLSRRTIYIINEVLKSAQINMIFSYKNYINKRYLKPLLFSEVLVKRRVIYCKLLDFGCLSCYISNNF